VRPLRLSVVAALLASAVYAVALGTSFGRELDTSVLEQTPRAAEVVLNALTFVIVNPLTVLPGLAATRQAFREGGGRAAAGIGLALAGTILGAQGLESALGALDPFGGEERRALGSSFFPSGHAAIVMTLSLIVVRAAPPARRRTIALVAGVAAGFLGSLIFAGDNHYPSDVVGGALLASAWTAAVVARWPGLAVASGPHGRAAAAGRARMLPVIAVTAGCLTAVALIWRPLLVTTAMLLTLTTVALAVAFERSLSHVRRPFRDDRADG